MYLIADGKSDLAFTLADTAADAVNGTDTFDGEQVRPRPWPGCTTTSPRWRP